VTRRHLIWIVAGIAVCLGAVVSRAVWDGRSALAEGDRAHRAAAQKRSAGDLGGAREHEEEAVARWRRAARWYVPGAPHVGAAYDRLEALAQAASVAGERDLSLMAWRAVRSSVLATRSFYLPERARLGRANAEIATLMAASEDPASGPSRDQAARRAWHLGLLERDESPRVGWAVLALLGFGAWVGGGFLFAWRGLGESDRLVPRVAARAGALIVVGLLVWALALYRA
jgi:hypothetical protein